MLRRVLQLCLLAVLPVLFTVPARAEDLTGRLQGNGVIIHYAKGTQHWAQQALELFPQANKHALSTLGMTTNRTVIIHLYATSEGFHQAVRTVPPDTLGVAIDTQNQIAINCAKTATTGPNSFAMTLRHEMIHIAFGRLMQRTRQPVPLWFNEGTASLASGRLHLADPQELVRAAATDTLYSFAEISRTFPSGRLPRELAYQQSEDAVRFLKEEFGDNAVRLVVSLMDDGMTFDQALTKVTGGVNFEAAWRKHARHRYSIFAFIRTYFSLFTMMAFFVIFAWIIYRARRRRIKRKWREEEEDEDWGGYF